MDYQTYEVTDSHFNLADCPTKAGKEFGKKEDAKLHLEENLQKMAAYQDKLYAEKREGLLIVMQAMDAAGKDSAIKHIFTILNPAGVNVTSFKEPSAEELAHDYLWRAIQHLPERGKISIFNRSYYEDVLVGKVHKLYEKQTMPERCLKGDVIGRRYTEIRNLETYLYQNGITILKFFLHLSPEEQARRFLKRIDDERKNWKFAPSDIRERAYWKEYMEAYQQAISHTATHHAPWYVIPADQKWYARCLISEIVCDTMKKMNPQYPELPEENRAALQACRAQILSQTE
jgi:PPK2 family polyphosphate:nucleotide phosphotransferase